MHTLNHFVHKIRHSEAWKRFSDHHWWYIVFVIVIINFVFGYFYLETRNGEQFIKALRQQWDYATIAKDNNVWWAVGLLKLWDIEQWRLRLLAEPNTNIDDSILPLKKAFFLESKWDFIGAEQLLSLETSIDPSIRALYLALRAYYFCLQKKHLECEVLADDSVNLDPLAPFWLQMQWIAKVIKRDFISAQESFWRAEKLGGLCVTNQCLYHRGLMHFYSAQYSGAVIDLWLLTGDELLWNDALLFLWRTQYNLQQRTWATELFTQVLVNKLWSDQNAELWLARVENAQWNTQNALDKATKTYEKWWYNIELLTDMLQYAHKVWNTEKEDQLINDIQWAVWNSVYAHFVVVRTLMLLWYLDLAEQYRKRGVWYTEQVEDEEQREIYGRDFENEWFQLWVFQFFYALQNNQPTQQIINSLQLYQNKNQHIAFLQLLQAIVQRNSVDVWTGIQTIPELVQPNERYYVLIWRDLLNEKPIEALERLIRELPWLENTPKHLWVKRAVTKRLWQTKLAQWYIDQLIADNVFLPTDVWQNQERLLWKQAFLSFHPWLSRMYPYLSPDRLWEEEVNSF